MGTILDDLAKYARGRVLVDKQKNDQSQLELWATMQECENTFSRNINMRREKGQTALICEVKKATPSKGIIDPFFDYMSIAADFEKAGADCISCMTEPRWFMGSDEIFSDIRSEFTLPMMRTDFVVDEYQIYQACCMGADAVLLICSILTEDQLARYLDICDELGLDALVETHDEKEVDTALRVGARMIGVNNRDLKDFSVDISNARRLRERIPKDILFVAESGVKKVEDIAMLHSIGADAIMVGEALMRADDRQALLRQMKIAAGQTD